MTTHQVFRAYAPLDTTEGSQPGKITIACFRQESDAKHATEGEGVQGTDAGTGVEPLVVYETFQDYLDDKLVKLRKSALEKLSTAERAALGFK